MDAYIQGLHIIAGLSPDETDLLRTQKIIGSLRGYAINGGKGTISLSVGNGHPLDHGFAIYGLETLPISPNIEVRIAERFYEAFLRERRAKIFAGKDEGRSLLLLDSARHKVQEEVMTIQETLHPDYRRETALV